MKFLVFIVSLSIVLMSLLTRLNLANVPSAYMVASGSMEPTIHVGDLLFIRSSSNYEIHDVITFYDHQHRLVTHRIISLVGANYQTQGDANNTPDTDLVSKNQIVGKVFFRLPHWGKLVSFAKSPFGFWILIIIPTIFLIIDEVFHLFHHAKTMNHKS